MRARIAASIVLAVGVVLGTAGCNMLAPQSTLAHYDPSDGVNGSVGDIDVRNAILISSDGVDANLSVTLINTGTKAHRVEIQHGTDTKQDNFVTVEPGDVKLLGEPSGTKVTFTNIDTKPGALLEVFFQYGNKTGIQLDVPVLGGTLPEYQSLKPTPSAEQTP